MTMTLEQFATQLDDSGVLSAEDLASFKESHCPEVESAEDLGKLLVKHNKVTRLQAQMVYQGQGDKLRFGNYVIQDKIGSGGMGDVYLARHRRMQREVALKLLPTAMAEDQNVIRRFQREVHAAAKLSHPNIVTAHDADEVDGTHYLVMEYVSGTDLSALVKQQGVLPVGQALDYILQAARGLEYAHQAGIIHRDIKPSNMLLDDNGTIKILDMGLARIDEVDEENPVTALTQSGSVMGTVDYMSPEQAQSTHTADNRSDIYSLGCTLYYLLTGNSVYGGKTVVNRILAHRDQPIPSLASANVQVPANVDAIYQKMIAKLPEDRFQSMQAVIDAIEKCDLQNPAFTMSTKPSDPELQKFLQSQKVESSPTIVMPAGEIEAGTQDLNPTSDFLNDTLNGTAFQPLQRPRKSNSKRGWVIAGLALAAFVFLAGIVFKVETPAGTVILEVDQPAAAGAMVSVDEEQKITINTGKNQEPIQVTADAKTHTLKVTKGGFETFTRQFTVKSGQTETIKVHLVPLVPLVVPETADSAPIMPFPMTDREIVEWILSVGGSVVVNSERNNLTSIKDMPVKPVEYYGVNLCNAKIPPHDLQRLANLKPLYSLRLSGESIAEQDLQYLKFVKGVHDLNLEHFTFEGDGLKYLSGFQSLKGIRFYDSTITGGGLSSLGEFMNLRTLDLVACTIDIAVMQQIGNRRQLNFLNLSNSQIDDAGLAHLSGLTKLKKFYAHMNPKITDKGVKSLSGMQELEVLTVGGTGITDAGLKQLSRLEQLTLLEVYNTRITDAGLAHLTKLKHLNSLNLRLTPITDAGLKHLSGLKQLKTLTLQETKVTPEGIATLQKALPDCTIVSDFSNAGKSRGVLEWVFRQGGRVGVNSDLHFVLSMEDLPDEPVVYYNVDLSKTKIPPQDLVHLEDMSKLATLRMDYTPIRDQDLSLLKNLDELEFLHLNHTGITGEGGQHLLALPELNAISVEFTKFTDAGLHKLSKIEPLRLLYVTSTDITNEGMQTIGEMKNLTKLKIAGNPQLNDTGIAHLANLSKLEYLFAYQNPGITDAGLKHLQGLDSLHEISLSTTGITDEGLKDLAGLKKLGKLEIVNCKITDKGLKHLYRAKTLQNLDLRQTKVTPEGIAALKRALPKCEIESEFKAEMRNSIPRSEREIAEWVIGLGGSVAVNGMSCKQIADLPDEMFEITAVALRESEFEDDQLASLANLKKLTGLYLDSSSISDTALTHLGKLQQLQRLNLAKTKITGAGLSSLGEIPGLMYLDLSESALTNVGLKNIGNLKQLVTLNIPTNSGIDDTGLAHIAGLKNLQELYLHNNPQLTDDGIKHLQGMHQLTELTLANTGISDAGMKYLSEMKDLEKLHLANCQRLSDAGFEHLANLKKLKSLQLFLTPITDAGLKHLYGLKKLEMLDLRDTKVTPKGIAALQKALPNCKLESNFKAAMLNGSPKTEREIAEWIIRIGGRVAVNRISCKQLAEIPDGTVVIDTINLREKNLKDLDLAPLAHLKKLEVIYLDSNPISDTALQYFGELSLLNTLSLPKTKMTGDGLKYLAGLSKLLTLDMAGAAITNSGLKDIGQLQSLLSLNISVNPEIGDAGLAHLATLTGLKKIFAHRNPNITDAGLKHLQGMQELELLSLGSTGITDVGLKQIAGFEKLNRLEIYNTRITDTGLKHLHGLQKLEKLKLNQTQVTPAGIVALKQALPNCKIESDFNSSMLTHSPRTQREIAEWVIELGGSVDVNGMTYRQLADLPDEMFVIDAIKLKEKNLKDPDLIPLAQLIKLEALFLDSNPISDSALQNLSGLTSLESLYLPKTQITGDGLKYLTDMPELLTLDIQGAKITNSGLKDFGKMNSLITLNIACNTEINDVGLTHLASLTKLRKLYAHGIPGITDAGLKHLQGMQDLELLTLGGGGITDAGIKQLVRHENLNRLELNNTGITDTGLEQLTKLRHLNLLTLHATSITDAGLKHIADLKNLQQLFINYNPQLTDKGIAHLQAMHSLTELRLGSTGITDAGLKYLYGLQKLKKIELLETKVTPAGIAALQQALPNCQITIDIPAKPTATN